MNDLEMRKKQLAREGAAAIEATAKFWKGLEENPEHSPLAQSLIGKYWESLNTKIVAKQEEYLSPDKKLEPYRLYLLVISSESLAVLTLRCIIQNFGRRPDGSGAGDVSERVKLKANEDGTPPAETKFTALAREIGRRCSEHWGFMSRVARQRGIASSLKKYRKPSTKERARKDRKKELKAEWNQDDEDLKLGQILLEIAEDAKIVSIEQLQLHKPPWKMPNQAKLGADFNQALEEWKEKHHDLIEQPYYLPMLVPPNPWGQFLNDGGYLSNKRAGAIHLVKHRNSPRIRSELRRADLAVTLAAINALQKTPWRVNKRIFGIMCKVRDMIKNKTLERAAWTRKIFRKLRVCEEFVEQEAIYFPYTVDFRGRAYCLPPEVNPQDDDIGRTLLDFAVPKPLGERGAYWLAVHVANSSGNDKISYKQRIDWVHSNEEKILAYARDPLKNMNWIEAKKPWRFLRACIEWEGHHAYGQDFESRLPILMDGTCNGLQHLSALRLDLRGAKATNLLPDTSPQDIYREVADELIRELEQDKGNGNRLAGEWLALPISRDVCKKAVMTTPYGVTDYGIKLQLRKEDFTEKLEKHGCSPITVRQVQRGKQFINKLSRHSDPISDYLWKRFPSDVCDLLESQTELLDGKKKALVSRLNLICEGASIYSEGAFAAVDLTDETKALINQCREEDRPRLNRLLLEDAYPRNIEKRSHRRECCDYLSGKLVTAIGKIVDEGNVIKNWLQAMARLLAANNVVVRWKAPQGFPVVHEEWKSKSKPVKVGKRRMYIDKRELVDGKPVLDPDAQASGIVANFIHSLDAAHLMLTIKWLHDADEKEFCHFAVIHDGYAVHSCDVDRLHEALRSEFVRIYNPPSSGRTILQEFRSDLEASMGKADIRLPPAPEPADPSFDIRRVLDSTYFFC